MGRQNKRSKNSAPSRKEAARDRARLLEYFMSHPDVPLENKTLARVLGEKRTDSWTRRLRELREPRYGGYIIHSHRDDANLRPGQYLFPKQDRKAPDFTVRISGRVRAEVLFRDNYTCQACGLTKGQRYEDGLAVALHVAHNLADSHGGKPDTDNCFTLCSRCNEAESNVGPDRPICGKVEAQVKKLPRHEQRRIFNLLRSIFER
jgi:hypothetical protein